MASRHAHNVETVRFVSATRYHESFDAGSGSGLAHRSHKPVPKGVVGSNPTPASSLRNNLPVAQLDRAVAF